jgi:hypothetical protein
MVNEQRENDGDDQRKKWRTEKAETAFLPGGVSNQALKGKSPYSRGVKHFAVWNVRVAQDYLLLLPPHHDVLQILQLQGPPAFRLQ